MNAVIYSRTTYVEPEGIDEEIDLGKRWLERHGHRYRASYADNGCSGSDLNRPQLNALFVDAAAQQFDLVVVLTAVTLASNTEVMETILVRLADLGVRVFTIAGRELALPSVDNPERTVLAADVWPYLRLVPTPKP